MTEPSQASVLVVDDVEENADILSRHVQKLGHRATVARGGMEALERMRAAAFDLVLLDVMMPRMNGHQVLEQMRQEPALRDVPVVVVSALTDVESIVRCVQLGAEDYLFKPINAILLRARVSACLEKKRLRDLERAHVHELEVERAKVDRLLLSLYPAPVVERLKAGQALIADACPDVTILFADIHDFARTTSASSPTEVVQLLNHVFSTFDGLAREHGVEKVKTVGDAYVAACGLPPCRADPVDAVADLALHMQREAVQLDTRLREPFSLRIGIHTGPVVAGVIGTAKASYDLWGSTVKIASHMEVSGLVGGIQVTETTYLRLRDRYLFEDRGTFYVPGEGEITTYLLKGKRGMNP
jgi:class 3 adenylate cyclase